MRTRKSDIISNYTIKMISFVLLILGLALPGGVCYAQEPDIAVVNIREVLNNTAIGSEISSKIKQFLSTKNTELRKIEVDLRTRQNNLQNLRAVLDDDEYQNLYLKIEREVQEFLEAKNRVLTEFYEFNSAEMGKFTEKIQPVLTKISQNRKVSIVITVGRNNQEPWLQPVFYFDRSIDITEQVIASLELTSPQKEK